jgi:hypothetical protein
MLEVGRTGDLKQMQDGVLAGEGDAGIGPRVGRRSSRGLRWQQNGAIR